MDGKEIELKLALPAVALERLKRHPAVKAYQRGRAQAKRLRAVYYDTPDHALAALGISVRVRASGRTWVQTVKTAGSRASGLFDRQEWEAPVATDRLEPAMLAATGLEPLGDPAVIKVLAPVFTTEVRRSIYRLGGDGWQVELALDRGDIQAGAARAPISEAELELLEGSPSRLFDLARAMSDGTPARLLASSKSERGYALVTGRPPAPVKSKPVAIEPEMGVADAFRAIARNCLHHLLANEQSLLASADPEAVHQMRVALRRLRSAFKLFRREIAGPHLAGLQHELKWLLGLLGPARDAEVLLAELIEPVIEAHAGNERLVALRQRWRHTRDEDVAAARAAVDSPRFTALLLDLGAWIEAGDWVFDPARASRLAAPIGPFARHALDSRTRKLRKAAGKRLDKLPSPDLHAVRILAKQLRYAGEFFAPLFGRAQAREYLAALAHAQDLLGEINDIAVAGPRLASSHHRGEEAWAAGMIAGWHEARRPHLVAEAEKIWKTIRAQPRFWRG